MANGPKEVRELRVEAWATLVIPESLVKGVRVIIVEEMGTLVIYENGAQNLAGIIDAAQPAPGRRDDPKSGKTGPPV